MSDITCQACRRDIDCADIRSKLQDIADAYQTWRDAVAAPIDVEHVEETSASFFALLDGLNNG